MPLIVSSDPAAGVTLEQTKIELNIEPADDIDDDELQFYIDAANEWMAEVVTTLEPNTVQLATVELIDHWWQSQRGPAALALADDVETLGLRGYGIPNRVRDKIQPWLKGTVTGVPVASFPDAACWPDPVF